MRFPMIGSLRTSLQQQQQQQHCFQSSVIPALSLYFPPLPQQLSSAKRHAAVALLDHGDAPPHASRRAPARRPELKTGDSAGGHDMPLNVLATPPLTFACGAADSSDM